MFATPHLAASVATFALQVYPTRCKMIWEGGERETTFKPSNGRSSKRRRRRRNKRGEEEDQTTLQGVGRTWQGNTHIRKQKVAEQHESQKTRQHSRKKEGARRA